MLIDNTKLLVESYSKEWNDCWHAAQSLWRCALDLELRGFVEHGRALQNLSLSLQAEALNKIDPETHEAVYALVAVRIGRAMKETGRLKDLSKLITRIRFKAGFKSKAYIDLTHLKEETILELAVS